MHRMQISVFGAVALVFAVEGVNTGIFADDSRLIAMGAGWFILTIVDIIWLLYFTSEEDSRIFYIFNLFGTGGLSPPSRRRRNTRVQSAHMSTNNGYATNYASGGVPPEGDYGGLKLDPVPPQRSQHSLPPGSPGPDANRSIGSGNMSGNGKLNAADTAPPGVGVEPNSPLMGGAAGLGAGGGSGIGPGSGGAASPIAGASLAGGRSTTGAESMLSPDTYMYKAKALYACEFHAFLLSSIHTFRFQIMHLLMIQPRYLLQRGIF
jgi:SHO1 osmosensor